MQDKFKSIGISGGTFDPVHLGHLVSAETLRQTFGLDRVIFIPSGMPPHKNLQQVTTATHRYNMLAEAIKTNPYFEVSRIEMNRTGYTYTVDTLQQLKEIYGENVNLFFIIGADVVHDILSWKRCREVFKLCEFIAVLRPGYEKDRFLERIEYLKVEYEAKIHIAYVPLIEISSTCIRDMVKSGKSVKYLVPESVEAYIINNKLYGVKNG